MTEPTPATIVLRAKQAEAVLCPHIGASLVSYLWHLADGPVHWLRPLSAPALQSALETADPLLLAGFPLVPYSNRIREGRFTHAEREIALAANWSQTHTIHGHGWQASWEVIDQNEHSVRLAYTHVPDTWPFAYSSELSVVLTPQHLLQRLTLRNDSPVPMPAGLGFHPYLHRSPAATLSAQVTGMWQTDAEVMPTVHVSPAPYLGAGEMLAVQEVALDHVFTGWDGEARIFWPERNYALRLSASPELRFLVVYTPPGEDFLCVEPVSHCTDAFNLAAQGHDNTGAQVIPPGGSISAEMRLQPEALA